MAQAPLELGRLFQLGYVTNHMDQALEYASSIFGVDDFIDFGAFDSPVTGGMAHIRVAQGLLGEMVFELIQPLGGDDAVYRDYLPADGFAIRLHHTAYYQDDRARWDRFCAAVAERGIRVALSGKSSSSEYVYVDLRAELGQYAEVVHRPNGASMDLAADRLRVKAAIAGIQAAATAS